MLSLELAQRYAPLPESTDDRDLVLHLIASHHGFGRPFAPVSVDPDPPAVIGSHDQLPVNLSAGDRAAVAVPHSLASGISERCGRLTQIYGWWGLAYVEAILRLGDWYGSQYAQTTGALGASTESTGGTTKPARRTGSAVTPLVLSGIDGANPLGFLTACGTLTALHAAGYRNVRMGWRRLATWQPVLTGLEESDQMFVARQVADELRGVFIEEGAEGERKDAQKRYDAARKVCRDKLQEIKERRLTGKEREDAIAAELRPLKEDEDRRRREWRIALRRAVPSPELAIGKHINCTAKEYRENVVELVHLVTNRDRKPLDFLAAFASDACLDDKGQNVTPTPFCFIKGSGQQYFLDTTRQLMGEVDPERVRATLFEPWQYRDKKLSMRWDPVEARRYALLERNPTARGNESRTVWMANLLAYCALVLFPSAPRGNRLITTAWKRNAGSRGESLFFTWPIWQPAIDLYTLRSLLSLAELASEQPDSTALHARSVLAAFRARRIKVGSGTNYKINFSSAERV